MASPNSYLEYCSDSSEDDQIERDYWRSSYLGASSNVLPQLSMTSVPDGLQLSMTSVPDVLPMTGASKCKSLHSSLSADSGYLTSQLRDLELSSKIARCKSYEHFKTQLKITVSTYHFLDPSNSRQFVKGKFDLDSSGMVMLQGALINAVANWEEFIVEIMKEGFSVFIEAASGNPPSLESLRQRLPSCDMILKKELRQLCQTQPADELMLNLMKRWGTPQCQPNPWTEHFATYCQNTISGNQQIPVFGPGAANSIDTLFSKLFQCVTGDCSMSEQILKIGRFRYKLRLNQEDEIELQIHSISALKNISRLYYALRCVFAHGHNQKTMTGALKDFPRNVAEFDLGNERAAKYYLGLYRRMEKYGRETTISYLTFINMVEFLKRAAFFLMRALAKWVYDATETCVWSYKPHS